MKNNYILALASAFFFFGSVGVKAQTILDEDFETENTDAENNGSYNIVVFLTICISMQTTVLPYKDRTSDHSLL